MLRRQFSSGHLFEKTIVHCLIFREDNCPLLRRQLYGAQFMVKITVFREDNQPVLHLQRRQSTSASYFGKTIVLVLKKTILLEKTILPFPVKNHMTCYKFECSHWLKLQHSDWRATLEKDSFRINESN